MLPMINHINYIIINFRFKMMGMIGSTYLGKLILNAFVINLLYEPEP